MCQQQFRARWFDYVEFTQNKDIERAKNKTIFPETVGSAILLTWPALSCWKCLCSGIGKSLKRYHSLEVQIQLRSRIRITLTVISIRNKIKCSSTKSINRTRVIIFANFRISNILQIINFCMPF